jgi:V/A-type H+/Na+-transporting ATPase subunit I
MIADMAQITLLARKRDAQAIVAALQNAGVVHIDPLTSSDLPKVALAGADGERRAALERQLARLESASSALGLAGVIPDASRLVGKDLVGYLEEVGSQADALIKRRQELENESQVVASYLTPARALAELAGTLAQAKRLGVLPFVLDGQKPDEQLSKLSQSLKDSFDGKTERYEVGSKSAGGVVAAVLVCKKADLALARTALSRAGLSELRFPGSFEGLPLTAVAEKMAGREKALPGERAQLQASLANIASAEGAALAAARLEVKDELARLQALEAAARGKYGVALQGWIPNADKPKLTQALAPFSNNIILQLENAPTHHAHHVPVKLVNNPIFQPFELFLKLFAPPAYGAFDPTPVLGFFFPLFFGFIIGDMGLALISGTVAYLLFNMGSEGKPLNISFMGLVVPPPMVKDIGKIMAWMAFWTFVWGFIYGEFFGTLFEHLKWVSFPGEEVRGLLYEAPLHRVSTSQAITMMNLALIPGIIQVLLGWGIRAYKGVQHGDKKHTYEGIGMVAGLIGLILGAFIYRNPTNELNGILTIVAIGCGVVFLACVFLSGVVLMLIEVISNGGNILSYLRLFAVGLAGAILANLATDLGWSLGQSLGVPGILVGIVVASFVHLAAITVTIIGHVLQPLRLHYAEFFTKFGFYDESGRPYKPLARLGVANIQK